MHTVWVAGVLIDFDWVTASRAIVTGVLLSLFDVFVLPGRLAGRVRVLDLNLIGFGLANEAEIFVTRSSASGGVVILRCSVSALGKSVHIVTPGCPLRQRNFSTFGGQ